MFSLNDVHYARDRYLELKDKVESPEYVHRSQLEQPGLLQRLQEQLADWADLIRYKRHRTQRA